MDIERRSHQPVNLGTMIHCSQHDSSLQVCYFCGLLVNQVSHLLLLSQIPSRRVDAHTNKVGAHVLCSAAAQNLILPILYQAQLTSVIQQADLQSVKERPSMFVPSDHVGCFMP